MRMSTIQVKVPDIGGSKDVPVIEILVKPGDAVKPGDSLLTLESEKATLDVPAPSGGVVRELAVKVGDKVNQGTPLLTLEQEGATAQPAPAAPLARAAQPAAAPPVNGASASPAAPKASAPAAEPRASAVQIKVPDIGSYKDVPVIELLVKPGDAVKAGDSLLTLESDKATLDIPAPLAGVVRELTVKVGDRVGEGAPLLTLEPTGAAAEPAPPAASQPSAPSAPTPAPQPALAADNGAPAPSAARPAPVAGERTGMAHASPSIRKLARELGVDLLQVNGSGPKGRIVREDVQGFVKEALRDGKPAAGRGTGLDLPPWPQIDFSQFGPIELQPLSRIKKISKSNLARNWVMIPHVTQFDEADITELERFRQELNQESASTGVKVTLLAFLVKACVAALKKFPELNSSLDGDQLVLKRYFHIGFAADTPGGLVVPVLRNADQKGVLELAREAADLAAKARAGKLSMADMQGGCFSISSLGGIGGTAFTPIINAPEVAILGVSRSAHKPVWDGAQFTPRLMLPLSLSYDHRVVDGALAARFTSHLSQVLGDMRRAML
jgi:pyruvate dehydrogenase E2 component (dihydrolipoamide acetyltransferase)